jgi:hypothetical protein
MSSDPRSKVDIPLRYGSNLNLGKTTLDRLDAVDPLRLALREPSDELIEKIARNASGDIMAYARDVINGSREVEDVITSVLLALAEAVTPDGK